MVDAVELTRSLIRYETINPPGNEQPCAEFLGSMLENAGFSIAYYPLGDNRANLIARIGGSTNKKPLCFSGHTDVVPLGAAPWSVAPFGGDIGDGRIYGRGSTDMKGGVAAFVAAAIELAPKLAGTPGLVLVISAGEETGCDGVNDLAARTDNVLGEAGAMIVAEPTANRPLVGHKGVLWMEGVSKGVTAHGSMPEKGVNAVYKAARVVGRLETLNLADGHDVSIGAPTLNIGWLRGGMNVNSVPDEARFGIDIRMVPNISRGGDPRARHRGGRRGRRPDGQKLLSGGVERAVRSVDRRRLRTDAGHIQRPDRAGHRHLFHRCRRSHQGLWPSADADPRPRRPVHGASDGRVLPHQPHRGSTGRLHSHREGLVRGLASDRKVRSGFRTNPMRYQGI